MTNETLHAISIPGLPGGWRAVAYRVPKYEDNYLSPDGLVETCRCCMYVPRLIVEKIQPRRIVLEETDEFRHPKYMEWYEHMGEIVRWPCKVNSLSVNKIWREVKE